MNTLITASSFTLLALAIWFIFNGYVIRNHLSIIFILLTLQIILNNLLESYLQKRLKMKYYHLIIAPGTIIHEASHALVAKASGCDITKTSLYNPNQRNGILGFIEYAQPVDRLQPLRNIGISFAPFFGCGFFLIALLNYLAINNPGMQPINPEIVDVNTIESTTSTITLLIKKLWQQIILLDLTNPYIVFALYLEYAFALGSAPSIRDIENAFKSLKENKIEALALMLFLISMILLTEYGPMMWEHGSKLSETVIYCLEWMLLILMISTSTLLAALPLSIIITETTEIRGPVKILPPLFSVLIYLFGKKYTDTPTETIIAASIFIYLTTLILLRHPEYFIEPKKRGL